MIGFIYVIKNHINNKLYIGQTTRTIEIRWKEHIRHSKYDDLIIYRAIRKYGVQNFYIEKLEEVIYNKQEELDARETYYISLYNTIDKSKGYNISTGGSTPKFYRKKLYIDSIKNLYVDKKIPLHKIAIIYNTSRYIICSELKKIGVNIRNRHVSASKINKINKELLVKAIANTTSLRKAAKYANIPYATFRSACIYNNIEYNTSTSAQH